MRNHNYRIDKATIRDSLPVRAEPYWASLGIGRALGYRRSVRRKGIWYARWTEPMADIPVGERPKYRSEALGSVHDLDYTQAVEKAGAFYNARDLEFALSSQGSAQTRVKMDTVEEACRLYVSNLRVLKGEQAAKRAEGILKAAVYSHNIFNLRLRELTVPDVQEWRNGLVLPARPKKRARTKKGANRIYRQFAAVLSYANTCGAIASDDIWKKVGPFPVADGRRADYLTLDQRRALLATCERDKTSEEVAEDRALKRKELAYCNKDLAVLLRGWFFSGARPGELAKACVRDLDVHQAKLTLLSAKNKKGEIRPRDFYLYEQDALEFFRARALGKQPDDSLITMADGTPWVNEHGCPKYNRWSRGMKAALRLANRCLDASMKIPEGTVAYTVRHTVITDLLATDEVDVTAVEVVTGTSAAMIKKNYYQLLKDRLQAKLSKRVSV